MFERVCPTMLFTSRKTTASQNNNRITKYIININKESGENSVN